MRSALRRHPVLLSAFALALVLTLFFAGRFVWAAIYWSQHREMPVQGWMTVGYVGHSWGLDPRALDGAAGTPVPAKGHPLTLDEIARARGVPVAQVIAEVTAAVQALKAAEAGR
jgi:hypothetical protein